MKLFNIFLGGTLLYGSLSGLQCHFGIVGDTTKTTTAESAVSASLSGNNKLPKKEQQLSIRQFAQQSIHSTHVALLYWNSTGQLDLPPLIEQCQFRNFTESATWPFFLQNLRLNPQVGRKLALYPTSDATDFNSYNWSAPSPIPLIAHTLPRSIANNLPPWIRFLPTPYELRGDARRWVDRVLKHEGSQFDLPFAQRKNQIVYRGNTDNEIGTRKQRLKVMELGAKPENQQWLNASTSTKGSPGLPQREQITFKYMLDVGGISGTTWTALRWKMASKSLVFIVDSGYVDWWHSMLVPMQHYIPVKFDLSDLEEQYKWAEAHPIISQKIAEEGARVALETTDVEYMRKYTRKQIRSMPTPTADQLGQYFDIMEDSRRRLQTGKNPMLFDNKIRNKNQKYECPPKLTPENI